MDTQGTSKQPLVGYGMNANGKRPLDTLENDELTTNTLENDELTTKKMKVDGEAVFNEGLTVASGKAILFPSSVNPVLDGTLTNRADGFGLTLDAPSLEVKNGLLLRGVVKVQNGLAATIDFDQKEGDSRWQMDADFDLNAFYFRHQADLGQPVYSIAELDRSMIFYEDVSFQSPVSTVNIGVSGTVTIADGASMTIGSTPNVLQPKCTNILLASGSATTTGQLCKLDGTGRVVPSSAADPVTWPSVGICMDTVAIAGLPLRLCVGGIFSVIVESGLQINPGDPLVKSAVQDGRAAKDVIGTTPGVFGVALTSGLGNVAGTILIRGLFSRADTN
jgi:hypothetical protein